MGRSCVLSLAVIGAAGILVACQGQPPPAPPAPAVAPAQVGAALAGPGPADPPPTLVPLPIATPAIAPPAPTPTDVPVPAPTVSPPPTVPAAAAIAANAATDCRFVLGFAAMRDAIGADVVGACTEEVRQIPGNGNAEQRTANGLLVYRAIDGRVLFVGNSRTWMSGPEGVSERSTNDRLPLEGDRQLVEALRGGGYIIYFRHAATDRNQQDSDPKNLANCATQRNLTDQGRSQARRLGEAIRSLGIPVGRVLSSEYCRALDHARLAFESAEVEPSLVLPDPLAQAERDRNTAALKRVLALPPATGTNTVLVSHSPNIKAAAGVDLPAEGGAVILKPEGGGQHAVVARLLPDEWAVLAEALAPR